MDLQISEVSCGKDGWVSPAMSSPHEEPGEPNWVHWKYSDKQASEYFCSQQAILTFTVRGHYSSSQISHHSSQYRMNNSGGVVVTGSSFHMAPKFLKKYSRAYVRCLFMIVGYWKEYWKETIKKRVFEMTCKWQFIFERWKISSDIIISRLSDFYISLTHRWLSHQEQPGFQYLAGIINSQPDLQIDGWHFTFWAKAAPQYLVVVMMMLVNFW